MLQTNGTTTAAIATTDAATPVRDSTKDAGRVHIGGGCMHFSDVTPAREATKDAGRVHIGGGCIHF